MKKTFLPSSILIITLFSLFVTSCDKISAPYVRRADPNDTSCVAPDFPALTSHFKRALLEDYTGHTCPNCPRAGVIARDLKQQYKDSLVVLAVHAGSFAKPSAYDTAWAYDFRTTAGTEWDGFFAISAVGNPNGMISRKGYPNNQQVITPNLWGSTVKTTIAEAPLIDLQILTDYNPTNDLLCIHTNTSFLQTITDRALNLSVLITEDSIIQPQKNIDPSVGATPQIMNFVHMHVLRGAVNGTWGTPVHALYDLSNAPVVKTFSVHLTTFNALNTMKPKNCHVIAFVYDATTKEVLQVAEGDNLF